MELKFDSVRLKIANEIEILTERKIIQQASDEVLVEVDDKVFDLTFDRIFYQIQEPIGRCVDEAI